MIGSDSVEAHPLADEIAENVKLERNLVETLEDAGWSQTQKSCQWSYR